MSRVVTLNGRRVIAVSDNPDHAGSCHKCVFSRINNGVSNCPNWRDEDALLGTDCVMGDHHYEAAPEETFGTLSNTIAEPSPVQSNTTAGHDRLRGVLKIINDKE